MPSNEDIASSFRSASRTYTPGNSNATMSIGKYLGLEYVAL